MTFQFTPSHYKDTPPLHTKEQESQDLNKQIEAFFRKGGKVQELPYGATATDPASNPFKNLVLNPKKDARGA